MTTYKELQDQIVDLKRKAEQARVNELENAIQQIKALMQENGITVNDLIDSGKKKGTKVKKSSSVKFQDANGNTWSGRGRLPAWLKGQDKEKFRVS